METDEGLVGIGGTAPAPAAMIVEGHFAHLLQGQDPANVGRLWDQMFRASLPYGRKGLPIMAISAVDIALWDLLGKARGVPVYELLGGKLQERLPVYATGNEVAWYQQFGFTSFKLAMPHGPIDGKAGIDRNIALVERTRELAGTRRRDHARLLHGLGSRVLAAHGRRAATVQSALDRGVPAAGRLRGLRRP